MRIEAVVSTHVHADHLSGERVLASRTGATLYYHERAAVSFPFAPLRDGARISLGNVVVDALHTPGHTPDSVTLLVTDRTRAAEPWFALTGDTLFVGDVGRPDLGGDDAGRQLFASLQRLLALPDALEIYPAHISGSPCGRAMSGKPSSTIGFERRHNEALQCTDAEEFVRRVLADLPGKPEGFEVTVALNCGKGYPQHPA